MAISLDPSLVRAFVVFRDDNKCCWIVLSHYNIRYWPDLGKNIDVCVCINSWKIRLSGACKSLSFNYVNWHNRKWSILKRFRISLAADMQLLLLLLLLVSFLCVVGCCFCLLQLFSVAQTTWNIQVMQVGQTNTATSADIAATLVQAKRPWVEGS